MLKTTQEFYAVTRDPVSIFKATCLRDNKGVPIVECLGARMNGPHPKGSRLTGGKLIALTRQGLILYDELYFHPKENGPQKPSPIEECGYSESSERTGGVIGLFLKYEDAFRCFYSLRHNCLDPEWEKPTKETLTQIGPDHPTFVISQSAIYSFIYNNPLE